MMVRRSPPKYLNKHSTQTLQQGLEEYYEINSSITDPRKLPPEFGQILLAHDVAHIVLGCDTNMYDELKLLPLSFFTSDFKFGNYIRTRQDPKIKPAIDIMYDDLIKQHGVLWLYSSIFFVLPQLLPEVMNIWFKTRGTRKYYPFFAYESLLNRSLLEIRQEFNLLPLIK
jgi:hypothetical protein